MSLRDRWPWLGLAIVAATVACCLRLGPAAMRVLWAEDGAIFLQDANRWGGLDSIWRPYAGYQHFIPRVIAASIVALPVDRYALATSFSCCLIVGLVAGLTFELSRYVTPSRVVRAMLALTVVLLPVAPVEVLGTAANLHSYCLWLVAWILLSRPRNRTGSAALGALGFAASLTEIQAILFLPFFPLRLRDRVERPKLAGLAAGMLLQVVTTLAASRPASGLGLASAESMAKGYVANGFLSLFVPQGDDMGRLLAGLGWSAAAAALLVLLAFVIWAFWAGTSRAREAIGLLAYGSVVTFALGYGLNPIPDYARLGWQDFMGTALVRYSAVSSLFLAGAVIVAAGEWLDAGHKLVGAFLLIAICASFCVNFRQKWTWRSGGMAWPAALDAPDRWCSEDTGRQWRTVPLSPPGIMIELPCAKIRQHAHR